MINAWLTNFRIKKKLTPFLLFQDAFNTLVYSITGINSGPTYFKIDEGRGSISVNGDDLKDDTETEYTVSGAKVIIRHGFFWFYRNSVFFYLRYDHFSKSSRIGLIFFEGRMVG